MSVTPDKNDPAFDQKQRSTQADLMIRKHAFGSGLFGYVPVPVVDALGIMAIQRKLLFRLAEVYAVPFSRSLAKDLLKTMAGGVASQTAIPVAVKMVPGINVLFGSTGMAAIGSASTYAIGKVFKKHFEDGGTLENFDPEKEKETFEAELKNGVSLSRSQKKRGQTKAG